MRFILDVLYLFETYFQLVGSKQNRCMNFLVVKQPCDIIVSLSEVYVRILTNQIVSIFNDLLRIQVSIFYFDMCKLLRADTFVCMCEKCLPNVAYSAETFKIINKPYLEYCSKKFNK